MKDQKVIGGDDEQISEYRPTHCENLAVYHHII